MQKTEAILSIAVNNLGMIKSLMKVGGESLAVCSLFHKAGSTPASFPVLNPEPSFSFRLKRLSMHDKEICSKASRHQRDRIRDRG